MYSEVLSSLDFEKKLKSLVPGIYSDISFSELVYTWDELEKSGDVKVTDGILSGRTSLEEETCLNGVLVLPDYITCIANSAFSREVGLSGVVSLGDVREVQDAAFLGCLNLKYVLLKGTTKIGDNAFFKCAHLEKIEVLSRDLFIGDRAFSWCIGLQYMKIPIGSRYTGSPFFGCNQLFDCFLS